MAIEKIVSIKDIGRFKKFNARGASGDFSKITLVYGPNGSGKSTLASIFSSLGNGSLRSINKRERVGEGQSNPEVFLRTNNGSINYKSGKGWSENNLPVFVFDSSFVNDNIYSGESVFKEQRSNLFMLLFLDHEGIDLLKEAEIINSEIAVINRDIAGVTSSIIKVSGLSKKELFEHLSPAGIVKKEHDKLSVLLKDRTFKALVDEYFNLDKHRSKKTTLIKEKKEKIFFIAEIILEKHQETVNNYLQRLSAGFRISNIGVSNFSNDMSQRLKYSIAINDSEEDVFDSNTVRHGKPYFDTLLSEADKRTLSLAFFMSKIESDPCLSKSTIVFDDPMSSFDSARKTATKQEVLRLSERASQVIILSHDINFLASFWLDSKVKSPSLIEVKKISAFVSELRAWDIARDYDSEYIKNYKMLHLYLGGDVISEREVASSIRVVLEEYFRQKFPFDFSKKEWLGDFLRKVRECGEGHNLFEMKRFLDELSLICEYASPFHHAPQPEIIEDELISYVKRTIDILQA